MRRSWCFKEVIGPFGGGGVVTLGGGERSFLDLSYMKWEMGQRLVFGMAYGVRILH